MARELNTLCMLPTVPHPRSPRDAAVWAPGFDGDLVRLINASQPRRGDRSMILRMGLPYGALRRKLHNLARIAAGATAGFHNVRVYS